MDNQLIVTASPHVTDNASTRGLMLNVIISLVPCIVASAIIFGWQALVLVAVTTAASVVFEYLYCTLMKKPNPVGDLSAVVTGIILALNLPVSMAKPSAIWIAVVGAFVAIVLTKQLFGGLGMNFANPALVGRIVLFSGFTARMTDWVFPTAAVDALSTATPLQVADPSSLPMMDLFLGVHGGVLGETCSLAILIGFVYLVATKTISAAIPVTYVATVAVMSLLCGQPVMVQLLTGGLLFGAVYMATDYVTSPFTLKGKIVFGLGLGVITCAIRFWGNMAEGVSFAILLMNLFVPYINDLTHQVPLGAYKPAKVKKAKKTEGGAE